MMRNFGKDAQGCKILIGNIQNGNRKWITLIASICTYGKGGFSAGEEATTAIESIG